MKTVSTWGASKPVVSTPKLHSTLISPFLNWSAYHRATFSFSLRSGDVSYS